VGIILLELRGHWTVSEKVTSEDPCDDINLNDLDGWIRRDSSGMCKTDNGERLGRNQRDQYQDSWLRFDNG
jgi:hypothetical protein